ncbi:Major Facilitator Superfamily protein [Gracilibacillus orientalis]|uniref:Major Facilitator Superfamily protein n=1 Tax=Gracilibacillus orientalis TaxID=334253 RepID=A0A1I4II47_9BACI|nr:MFS transporter [Gracilibacillus orientalis]SFL53988.1 Major Facilitator Superfamily protein [Gracilibacillus orientalis]
MKQSIFRNRTYMLLLIAGIFAIVGFSMFLTTTTWYIINVIGSPGVLGIALITATVPRLILITFGGVLADKYKKTTIMFSTNLIQAFVLFCIFWLVASDSMTLTWLFIMTGVFGMLDAFFGPASSSLIPKVVEKSQLQQANAYFQGIDQISFIIGPILAGVIMETSEISTSYLVATILVLLSALVVFPPFIKEGPVEHKGDQSTLEDFREGIAYMKSSQFLLTGIIVLITLNFFIFGGLQIAMPLLVDLLGGTPINLSFMEVSLGIGMVIGTLIMSFVKVKRKGFTSLMGLFASLASLIIFSFATNLMILTAILFLIGFSIAFVFVPFFTAAQENTENRIMGRVMSIIFLAMNGFDPIAYGVVSALVSAGIDIQLILLASGVMGMSIAIWVWFKGKTFIKSH